MHKWLNTIMALSICVLSSSVDAWETESNAYVSVGYRQDNASWVFKAPSRDPIFKSSVALDEVHILDLGLHARGFVNGCFYARGRANWGWVLDGDFREKFTEFNRLIPINGGEVNAQTNPASLSRQIETGDQIRVESLLDGRYTVDLDIAVGYPIYFCNCTLKLIPIVGYGYHEQNYRFDQNERIIIEPLPLVPGALSSIERQIEIISNEGSDSKFVAHWWGPFIGFDIDYSPSQCWTLYSQFEWHLVHFKGKRFTRVRQDDFDNYERSTHNAHGFYLKVGFDYDICDCWTFGIYADYEDFKSHKTSSKKNIIAPVDIEPTDYPLCVVHALRVDVKRHGYSVGITAGRVF